MGESKSAGMVNGINARSENSRSVHPLTALENLSLSEWPAGSRSLLAVMKWGIK
jgi:hypothetical protein